MSGSVQAQDHGFGEKRLRVLVDMDGVLCNFEGHFLEKFREKFPDEPFIPLEERTTFYLYEQYSKLHPDLPKKTREIFNAEGFFLNLPEIEGGCGAVKEMAQMEDVDVFICTSLPKYYKFCLKEKCQWIEEHLGREWVDQIIFTKDKTMVNGHILIDDRPHITGVCQSPPWQHVLFTTWFNRTTELDGRTRLDSWTDGKWREVIEDFERRL